MSSLPKPRSANTWFVLLLIYLVSQNINIYSGHIPLLVVMFPILLVYLIASKTAVIHSHLLLLYIGICVVCLTSLAANLSDADISVTSAVYLIFLMLPFILKAKAPDNQKSLATSLAFWSGYQRVILLCALLAFLQLAAGNNFLSFKDLLPKALRIEGYNTTNAISYGVDIYRSNGFFFLEPSFFSQFTAIAILIEFKLRRRLWLMIVLFFAMLSTVSGTGLVLLGFGLAMLSSTFRSRRSMAIWSALTIVAVGLILGPFSSYFVERIAEFTTVNSSAYIRFVAPILYIYNNYIASPLFFAIGAGPGASTHLRFLSVQADLPSLGQGLFEYGFFGGLMVVCIYYYVQKLSRVPPWLIWTMFVFQMFLSGGLLQPATVLFFLLTTFYGAPALIDAGEREHITQTGFEARCRQPSL